LLMPSSSLRLVVFMVWLGVRVYLHGDKFVSRAEVFQGKCEQPVAPTFQPASRAVLRESCPAGNLPVGKPTYSAVSNQGMVGSRAFSDETQCLSVPASSRRSSRFKISTRCESALVLSQARSSRFVVRLRTSLRAA